MLETVSCERGHHAPCRGPRLWAIAPRLREGRCKQTAWLERNRRETRAGLGESPQDAVRRQPQRRSRTA